MLDVDMPIAAAVARVLYDGLPPRDAVRALMERDPKAEA
jgi:glycerol-3-phosphate dehydrogenase